MAAIHINRDQFKEVLGAETPVLVDFWAPWCSYCRRIGPAFDIIAEQFEGQLIAGKINIDEEESLADAQGIEIIPTLVMYRNGKAIGSVTAPDSKAAIEKFIQDTLAQ